MVAVIKLLKCELLLLFRLCNIPFASGADIHLVDGEISKLILEKWNALSFSPRLSKTLRIATPSKLKYICSICPGTSLPLLFPHTYICLGKFFFC